MWGGEEVGRYGEVRRWGRCGEEGDIVQSTKMKQISSWLK